MHTYLRILLAHSALALLLPICSQAATVSLSHFASYTGTGNHSEAGYAVIAAGDIDADGFDDLLIGAPGADSGGEVYLIYGQTTPFSSSSLSEAITFSPVNSSDSSGASVAVLDMNGDGFDDLVFGAPGNDTINGNNGAVFILYGQTARYTSTSLSSGIGLYGHEMNGHASFSLANAGDLNRDGFEDLLVGAYAEDANGPDAGAVYIVYGQSSQFTNGTSLTTFTTLTGESASDNLGTAVAGAGDVNGDGYDDLLIGAHHNDLGGSEAGAAYLVLGRSTQLSSGSISSSMATRWIGTSAGSMLGASLSGNGDVNGDGFDDIIIGSQFSDDAGTDAGAAYLQYGSATTPTSGLISTTSANFSSAAGNEVGSMVGIAGDINHDGYADLLISAADIDGANTATAFVVFGSTTNYSGANSLSDDAIVMFSDITVGDDTGSRISFGDLNGDGFQDLVLGAPNNDAAGTDAGAVYVGYPYIDEDGDGVPGSTGLFIDIPSGTAVDCDDTDSSTSCTSNDITISKVKGGRKGKIKVTYSDDSVIKYRIFTKFNGSKRTRVRLVSDTTYVVLHAKGKKLALVDASDGTVLSRKKISRQGFKQVAVKVLDVRNDGKLEAVATLRKPLQHTIKVAVIRIKSNLVKLKKKDILKFQEGNRNVYVKKTVAKRKQLRLRTRRAKIAVTIKANRKYHLHTVLVR